jgi:acyl carrier protein
MANSMDRKDIVLKLTKLFQTVFNDSQLVVTDQMTANDVAGWDSLSHMVLIMEIEDLFEIKIKLKELNKMRNVGDMVEIINQKI